MTSSIVWRIVWKEYRALRTLWIAVAAMAVMIQWWIAKFGGQVSIASDSVHIVAAIMAALYGLAAAATLFAREREEGTRDFLAWLPGSDAQVAAGKLLLLAASTAAFFAAAWCTASLMVERRGYILPSAMAAWSVESWSVAIVELVGWGLLFSLVMRRVVLAAVLAATAELVTVIALSWIVTSIWFRADQADANMMIARLAVAGVVYAVALWHAARWLRGTDARLEAVGARDAASSSSLGAVASRVLAGVWGWAGLRDAPAWQGLARLMWQTVRQSWRMHAWLVALWLATMVLASMWLTIMPRANPANSRDQALFGLLFLSSILMAAVLPALAGVETFLHDQAHRRYRYFAEHAIAPRQVWLARQTVGLTVTLVMAAVLLLGSMRAATASVMSAMLSRASQSYSAMADVGVTLHTVASMAEGLSAGWGFYWLGVLACYAAGQFASMFLRGGILAAVTALVMSFGLLFWLQWMIWLDAAWWWSSAPLIAALFAATWLRADGWATDRGGWRYWALVTSSVLVPLAAVVVAVPLYRAYQLPLSSPGFDVAEFRRVDAEAAETTAMYQRAWGMSKSSDRQAEALALTLEASRRPRSARDSIFSPSFNDLHSLILAEANRLAADGDLEKAWSLYGACLRMANHAWAHGPVPTVVPNYCAKWIEQATLEAVCEAAASSGASAEQIERVIVEMEEIFAATPPIDEPIKQSYVDDYYALAEGRATFGDAWALAWKPWERVRRMRALAIIARVNLERLRYSEEQIASGATGSPLRFYSGYEIARSLHYASYNPLARAAIDPFYRDGQMFGAPIAAGEVRALRSTWMFGAPSMLAYRDLASALAHREMHRRATILVLAAMAWRAEHGALPDSTRQISKSQTVDPWTGQPFMLVEQTADTRELSRTWTLWMPHTYTYIYDVKAANVPNGPSVWCIGPRIEIEPGADARFAGTPMILDANLNRRLPTSMLDLLAAGQFFAIPEGAARPARNGD